MVPTKAHASDKDNVIPSRPRSSWTAGCPGRGGREVRSGSTQLLGPQPPALEVEFAELVAGNSSPTALAARPTRSRRPSREPDPDATLAPIVMPGFSDSNWFRKAFARRPYGFCPQRQRGLFEAAPLIHGADERAPAEDVAHAGTFLRRPLPAGARMGAASAARTATAAGSPTARCASAGWPSATAC